MIEAHPLTEPSATLLRRTLASLAEATPSESAILPVAGWRDDLRFFATAYVAGLIFFLLLLA